VRATQIEKLTLACSEYRIGVFLKVKYEGEVLCMKRFSCILNATTGGNQKINKKRE
jgi:hypothetical protein